jgi:hypothetical protein
MVRHGLWYPFKGGDIGAVSARARVIVSKNSACGGGADFPFATRAEFVEAIEAGGVAAVEVLACDLKALGLYTVRSLSYDLRGR